MRAYILSILCLAALGFSSCAAKLPNHSTIKAEFCDDTMCIQNGLPLVTRTYGSCLLVEHIWEDGSPYHNIECFPSKKEAPEFTGEVVRAGVFEYYGEKLPANTLLVCRIIPQHGMTCWPRDIYEEWADYRFPVFLSSFRQELEEKGITFEKGKVFEDCTLYDEGNVACYEIVDTEPHVKTILILTQTNGFHGPIFLPFAMDLDCQWMGDNRLECYPAGESP